MRTHKRRLPNVFRDAKKTSSETSRKTPLRPEKTLLQDKTEQDRISTTACAVICVGGGGSTALLCRYGWYSLFSLEKFCGADVLHLSIVPYMLLSRRYMLYIVSLYFFCEFYPRYILSVYTASELLTRCTMFLSLLWRRSRRLLPTQASRTHSRAPGLFVYISFRLQSITGSGNESGSPPPVHGSHWPWDSAFRRFPSSDPFPLPSTLPSLRSWKHPPHP